MSLVSLHNRPFVYHPPENSEGSIEDRHPKNQYRNDDRHNCRTLYRPQNRQGGEHESQIQRTSVAHKNLCRIKVERKEPKSPSCQCQHSRTGKVHSMNICNIGNAKGCDGRCTCRQTVKPVDEVHRIGNSDYPYYRHDETNHRAQFTLSVSEEVGYELNPHIIHIHYYGDYRLSQKFRLCGQILKIIYYTQNVNKDTADNNARNPRVSMHKNQHRCSCSYENSHPAKPRHRLGMHSPTVLWNVHSSDFGSNLYCKGCSHQ